MISRDPETGASILRKIEAAGHAAPRVHLRDLSGDEPEATESTEGRRSRYLTLGRIARGGVGEILKSRDGDLGRSVAMKVLREEHAKDPEMVRRFIEEAQISGQLQHPGIVPVYELGVEEDGRPWFAMKLVRGESLAARLAKRPDPSQHRRRYLAIFERVCQTVAYAHSRGVIHRDLKPSNVMLGTFGDIQVVDWGFAKVLGQGGIVDERRAKLRDVDFSSIRTVRSQDVGSESMAGSVMGTPPYMPPEQALGHLEDLDERSDVFSLGAVLTEILTGSPPYVGEREDLMVMASQARLEDAHERLDGCGADAEITDLARSCLAPLRADRPESAKEVADAVSAFLARLVQKAHESKLTAIKARTQEERARARTDRNRIEAEEQKHRRRHFLTLAAIVLAAVLAGGGIFLYVDAGRAERARTAAAEIAREERVAHLHEGRGEWEQALQAAHSALGFASSAGASERERLEQVLARIEDGKRRADKEAAKVAKDDALVRTLEEILPSFGYETDGSQQALAYAAAFRDYGVDLAALDVDRVVLALSGSHRKQELAGASDRWAMYGKPGWEKLAEIARKLDPDPTRDMIWEAWVDGEHRGLRAEAAAGKTGRKSATIEALIGMALLETGRSGEAIDYLSGALGRHPGDLQIVLLLARAFELRQPPFRSQVLRYLIAALALRPENLEIRHTLALATRAAGTDDPKLWEDALRNRKDWAHGFVHLCRARIETSDFRRAVEAGRRAVEIDPGDPEAQLALAEAEMFAGDLESAVKRSREAGAGGRELLARALLIQGRLGEAHEALAGVLRTDPGSDAGKAAKGTLDRWEEVVRVYQRWPEISSGKAEPATGAEALTFARSCLAERRYASAAEYFMKAFEADKSLEAQHRELAARAAAGTGRGLGRGADLTPKERAIWRTRARVWAEEFFEAARGRIEKTADPEMTLAVYRLVTRQELGALVLTPYTGVREMAQYERTGWSQFRRQVIRLLKDARQH